MTEKHEISVGTLNDYLRRMREQKQTIQCYLLGAHRGPLKGVLESFDDEALFLDPNPEAQDAHDVLVVMRHAISHIVPGEGPQAWAGRF